MFKKIIAIIMVFALLTTLSGCALKEAIKSTTYTITDSIAEHKLTKYLKEKYPEKTFKVKLTDEASYLDTDISLNAANADESTKLCLTYWELIDENGDKFTAIVNNFDIFPEVLCSVADNVQTKEIEKAIHQKLNETFNTQNGEQGYWLVYNAIEYTEAKYSDDIVDFLKNHRFIDISTSRYTKYISAIYFYQNDTFDYNVGIKKENTEFLEQFNTIQFVKYEKNMPPFENFKALLDDKSFNFSSMQSIYFSALPDVEKVNELDYFRISLYKDNPSKWISQEKWETKKEGDIYYRFEDDELAPQITELPDIALWEKAITEHQNKYQENWMDYKIITDAYVIGDNQSDYYLEKPENTQDKLYKLFVLKPDNTTLICPIYDNYETYIFLGAHAYSNIAGDYIYITSADLYKNCTWFVVECTIE